MKISKQKLYNAMHYINEINGTPFYKLDVTDIIGRKITKQEEETIHHAHGRWDNMEIIKRLLNNTLLIKK